MRGRRRGGGKKGSEGKCGGGGKRWKWEKVRDGERERENEREVSEWMTEGTGRREEVGEKEEGARKVRRKGGGVRGEKSVGAHLPCSYSRWLNGETEPTNQLGYPWPVSKTTAGSEYRKQ